MPLGEANAEMGDMSPINAFLRPKYGSQENRAEQRRGEWNRTEQNGEQK